LSGQRSPFGDLVISPSLTVPAKALGWNFSRSSGPGGQGVNTADSRVELSVHLPGLSGWPDHLLATALDRLAGRLVDGTLTVSASEHRQQIRNREAARARMAGLLRTAIAPDGPARRPTRPSAGARQRRLDAKRRRSAIKQTRRAVADG
jgi:ribosome-associated protein